MRVPVASSMSSNFVSGSFQPRFVFRRISSPWNNRAPGMLPLDFGGPRGPKTGGGLRSVSYTHLRAHETSAHL
eukprot:5558861-Alexandrium_andersonii.AAC.1